MIQTKLTLSFTGNLYFEIFNVSQKICPLHSQIFFFSLTLHHASKGVKTKFPHQQRTVNEILELRELFINFSII